MLHGRRPYVLNNHVHISKSILTSSHSGMVSKVISMQSFDIETVINKLTCGTRPEVWGTHWEPNS